MILGPNLSFNLPMTIPTTPNNTKYNEKAPDVIALVQPKSADNGLKNKPYVICALIWIGRMKQAAATIT